MAKKLQYPAPVANDNVDLKLLCEPIELHFYDEDDEVIQTYTKRMLPWGLLKKAIKLSENLTDADDITEEEFDRISGYICGVFGDKFTPKELEDHADISEVMGTFRGIVKRAKALGNG
jgi:hypothetical protein